MLNLENLKRFKEISWFFYKYGYQDILKKLEGDINIRELIKEKGEERGKAKDFVRDLQNLGPSFIKLGQVLSTQAQFLFPPEYEEELAKLQDHANPVEFNEIEKIIEKELGTSINRLFESFDPIPISSASIGQVHKAVLPNGHTVAVKVQRPYIDKEIAQDLELFKKISDFLEAHTDRGKKMNISEKFREIKNTLIDELDYNKEANNLSILKRNLKNFNKIKVPAAIKEYTTQRILTMEFIPATKITKLSPVVLMEVYTEELATQLLQAYLQQICVDGFFHMDPHPGNIYITTEKDLVIYDLGMVGYIPSQMQLQLIKLLFSLSEGRELEVLNILISMGKSLEDFNEYSLRTKIAELIAPNAHRNLKEMSVGQLVIKLAFIAGESGLWLPSQISTIGKTLLSLDQVGRVLSPNLNINEKIKDNASELINKKLNAESPGSIYTSFLELAEISRQIPSKFSHLLDLLLRNDLQFKIKLSEYFEFQQSFEKIANRITIGLILAALIIGASLLMDVPTTSKLMGYPAFAMIFFILAAIGAVCLIFSIIWNDVRKKRK
jgi:ubiquinone biosynthesis protein